MRAAYYERTGPASEVLQVGELLTPTPGAGEVRVKLSCSGVNPSDVKNRAGTRSAAMSFARVVPHSDGAGTIDAVGAGVAKSRLGQRVWTWNAAWLRADGTAAEYVVLPEAQAVPLPASIDFAVGACLGIPALTAYHAVHVNGGVQGQTVLVAGGAGAVGQYAIQMAKQAGAAQVIATVSGAEKAAVAAAAGAEVVLNYKTESLEARIAELYDGRGVDRIIEVDFAANAALDLAIVKRDGDIVVYGSGAPTISVPFFPAVVKNARVQFFIVYNLSPRDRAAAIGGLTTLLEQGALSHNIAVRLPLERIAEAHELVERGQVIGNVVVDLA